MPYPNTSFTVIDRTTTVRFQITAGKFGTKTFDSGSEAYDFVRAAIKHNRILNLSLVSGPGAGEYSERAVEVFKVNYAESIALAAAVAESATD